MSRKTVVINLIIIAILLVGCKDSPQASPTAAGVEETQAAMNSQATTEAAQTVEALSTNNAQATADAGATATVVFQETQNAENTQIAATAAQEQSFTATAEIVQQATAQAQPMMDALQPLLDEGIITTMEGEYFRLMDYSDSLAKLNYVAPGQPTGFNVENFALKAKLAWNSASDQSNWHNSGCGFLFGFSDFNKFDYITFALNGYVMLSRPNKQGNQIIPIAAMKYSGNLSVPEGDAEILLVVFNKRVYAYVNDEKVLDAYDGLFVPGPLVYTMVSGTNKGYGTTCKITDVGLWQFLSQ